MSATKIPRKVEVLSLFRSLLRHSSKIMNYNFCAHAKRRSRAGFEYNRTVGGEDLMEKYKFGLIQLEIVKRQAIISHLYPDSLSSVMQNAKAHK